MSKRRLIDISRPHNLHILQSWTLSFVLLSVRCVVFVIVRAQDLIQTTKRLVKIGQRFIVYSMFKFLMHFSGTTIGMDFSTRWRNGDFASRHGAVESLRYKSQTLPSIFSIRTTPTSHSPKHSSNLSPSNLPLCHKWILFPPSFSPKSTMLSLNPPPMRRLAEVPATGTALSLGRSSTRPL